MSWLTHTEELLDAQRPVSGDPKVIEVELAKHHVSIVVFYLQAYWFEIMYCHQKLFGIVLYLREPGLMIPVEINYVVKHFLGSKK